MNCDRFERRLDALLDERMSPESDAELNAHAEHCPACGRMLADYQALAEGLALLAWVDVCEELGPRVVAEISQSRPAAVGATGDVRRAKPQAKVPVELGGSSKTGRDDSARRERLRAAGWLAAAVAAVLLVGVGMHEWTGVHVASPDAHAKTSPATAPTFAATAPRGNDRAVVTDSPSRRSIEEVSVFAGLSPQQRNLMEQMSDGLKPVTHSMSAALRALRRTLPGSEAAVRSS